MKLKTPIVLGLSLCMLTGVAFSASACGETEEEKNTPPTHTEHVDNNNDGKCDECGTEMPKKDNPGDNQGNQDDKTATYSVTIEGADATILADMSVLFFSKEGTSELKELRGTTSASADLEKGDYMVYLVGDMPGYTQTPVKLSSSTTSGKIKVDPVKPISVPGYDEETGNPTTKTSIYYQILVLLPDGKTVYFGAHPEEPLANSVQICTYSEDGIGGACYNAFVDSETGLAWHNGWDGDERDWAMFPESKHQVHFSLEEEWPEGCKFDDEKYILSEKGGFFTVRFDKA